MKKNIVRKAKSISFFFSLFFSKAVLACLGCAGREPEKILKVTFLFSFSILLFVGIIAYIIYKDHKKKK